ncbi:MAG: hypothetical protein ACI8P3_003066 [Saprospiraceae bacterium]|jgi:hypothetical protein
MRKTLVIIISMLLIVGCQLNKKKESNSFSESQIIVSEDISNFWKAYDAIKTTNDSLKQMKYLQTLFLDNASDGQKRMMEARRYTPEEYLLSINNRSKFWNSIRKNTENIKSFNEELRKGVEKLVGIYPPLNLSTIYYTIGNHRSPGTGVDSLVLLGTEFALGDSTTFTSELPEHNQNYYKINPTNHLQFLCVHEYVHTQQRPIVHNLLSLTLYEGIAEFVAIQATGRKSPWKAFTYGPENEDKIKQRFEEDIFRPNSVFNWLWNSPDNEFQTSELGYYIGFQIASLYFDAASNKKAAIKTLIELDYSDESEVEKLVNSTNYFSNTLDEMRKNYESTRPEIVSISEFSNNSKNINATLREITINFSKPMNKETRGFDFGPLGEDNVLRVQKVIGFSKDGKSFSFEVKLEENKQYQSLVTNRFQSISGFPLKPFLIDFKTK